MGLGLGACTVVGIVAGLGVWTEGKILVEIGTCSTAGLTPGQSCSGQGACNGAESVVGCNR